MLKAVLYKVENPQLAWAHGAADGDSAFTEDLDARHDLRTESEATATCRQFTPKGGFRIRSRIFRTPVPLRHPDNGIGRSDTRK
jgi:hypothetical protein